MVYPGFRPHLPGRDGGLPGAAPAMGARRKTAQHRAGTAVQQIGTLRRAAGWRPSAVCCFPMACARFAHRPAACPIIRSETVPADGDSRCPSEGALLQHGLEQAGMLLAVPRQSGVQLPQSGVGGLGDVLLREWMKLFHTAYLFRSDRAVPPQQNRRVSVLTYILYHDFAQCQA
jgi:hypothetical protein